MALALADKQLDCKDLDEQQKSLCSRHATDKFLDNIGLDMYCSYDLDSLKILTYKEKYKIISFFFLISIELVFKVKLHNFDSKNILFQFHS